MSNEFMREERYIVFKLSDVERYLTDKDRANIAMMKMEIDAGRDCANKPPFKGLIVEADWPEYEPTWKAIEARVTGTQQVPDGTAIQTAARILNIDLIRQRDELRAKIEQMEQIAPSVPRESIEKMLTQLMDIAVSNGANSVSMPDEYVEVAAWLCGSPAQPAPSVPEGWMRAIDEALVIAHIGVANAHDTYEQAKAKLDSLIGLLVDIATDPAVNGGWKLMPVEPTKEIYECFAAYDGSSYSNPFDFDDFSVDYAAALAAAPEAKP